MGLAATSVQAALIAEYTFEPGTYTGADDTLVVSDQAGSNDGTFAKVGSSVVSDPERGSVLSVTSEGGGGMHTTITTVAGGSLSYAAWIKTTDSDGYLIDNQSPRSIVSVGGSTGGDHGYYNGSWYDTGVTVPTDGQWHHYAYVLDATAGSETFTVYLDGSVVAGPVSISGVDPLGTGGAQVFFARYSDNSGVKRGSFDDLRVYDHALSAEEVQALAVPEPSVSVVFAFLGLFGFALCRRRG